MRITLLNTSIILLLLLGLNACTSRHERNKQREETQQALMKEHVDKRRITFIEKAQKDCRRAFYSKAISIVDSILLLDAKSRLDTIPKPERVDRPDKPELMEFIDSSELKPLFDSLSFEPPHQGQTKDSTEVIQQTQD